MKRSYLFIVLLIALCSSCNKSNTSIDSFDVVTIITDYDSVYSDKGEPLGRITDLEIIDNVLIAKHSNDAYYFSFIDVNSRKMLRRWGSKGEGPNEYIQLATGFAVAESRLVFLESAKKEINYVSIADILKGNDTPNITKETYPYTVDFRPMHLGIVNDKKIFLGLFKEGRFGTIDSENAIIDCSFDYPFKNDEVKGLHRGIVFQSNVRSNNKQNKMVISTIASDVFEIYQASDSGFNRTYVSPFNHPPEIQKVNESYALDYHNSMAGLLQMGVSEDLICFTYSSESYDKISRSESASNEILSFNWHGDKRIKYILPFPISSFCIDKHHLYGVRYCGDEMVIYRFKL